MYKYQNEFLKFVNEKIGKHVFCRGEFFDFCLHVPQDEKEKFFEEYRVVKGWSKEELKEKLF